MKITNNFDILLYKDYIVFILGIIIGIISTLFKNRYDKIYDRKKMLKDKIRNINPIIQKLKVHIAYYIFLKSKAPSNIEQINFTKQNLQNGFTNYESKFYLFLQTGYDIELKTINKPLFNSLNELYINWSIKKESYYENTFEVCKEHILKCDKSLINFLES
jgi:hypothetical protein